MKEAIIFGCGGIGTLTYNIINQKYKVRAWVDNNKELWGKKKNDIEILSPDEMRVLTEQKEYIIFVAVTFDEFPIECATLSNFKYAVEFFIGLPLNVVGAS